MLRKPRPRFISSLSGPPSKIRRGPSSSAWRRRLASLRVPVEQLRWQCDPAIFDWKTTAEVRAGERIIGQEKAMRALALGINMASPGYNVFVCGQTGTGRSTAIRHVLAGYRRPGFQPVDLAYVPNFEVPDRPRLLSFPAGEGARFRRDVQGFLERVVRLRERVAPAHRRRELRELVERELPELAARSAPGPAAEHLERLGRAIVELEGRFTPEELGVNLISQPSRRSPPVVFSTSVNIGTLFGMVDRQRSHDAARLLPFPHASIRAGAIVEASGGVLVVDAADLLAVKGCWSALKSCLEHGRLDIRHIDPASGNLKSGLKPDPIPLSVKVILVGDFSTYDYLFAEDPDFVDLFKVRVDFDSEVELTRRLINRDYPAFIARVVRDEGLRELSAEAVARVIEFGVRRAGRKNKITTQFSTVADLLREASFWAGRAGLKTVRARDVQTALRESLDRLNLVETKIGEMIVEGTILIDTAGHRVGQVNGLAMYDQGDYVFGKPSRITAETSVGQGGIINIERESGFSGRSHDKGIQILGGYLRSRFAQRRPLSLTASVCFEQCYSGVDGDSASSTEIYAILSSLSGLPIRQDMAVTGSMNQKGDIQPIGGVNEKIEGFFDCVAAGRPTGREGVIIPRRNLPELMLREDVVQAVRRGRFHIYAIRTVEEGIEILTGVPAGRARKRGNYPAGTVFARADERLEEIAQGLRRANQSEGDA
jgi:lon-related putative ATP-dependent protease